MEKTIYLLRGCPGAGKSTLANNIVEMYKAMGLNAVNNSADDYHYENGPNPGEYDFDFKNLGKAHKQCQSRTADRMHDGYEAVIVSNTLTTEKEIKPYADMAKHFGYRVVSLIVENRHSNKSVHNVPEDRVKEMADRFTFKLT